MKNYKGCRFVFIAFVRAHWARCIVILVRYMKETDDKQMFDL